MKARVVVLVAAVLVALLGVGAVVLYAQSANSRAVADAKPTQVYVSAKVVPAGTSLQDAVSQGLLARTNVPANAVPSGSLTTVTTANQGLVAVNDIQAGEFILSARFATAAVGVSSIAIPKGLQATTVQFSNAATMGSFLTPGSRIVIYDTHDAIASPSNPSGGKVTQVLLEDVYVIAVNDRSIQGDGGGLGGSSNSNSTLVTVALGSADTLRLVQAVATGELYAALRGSGAAVTRGASVNDGSLFSAS